MTGYFFLGLPPLDLANIFETLDPSCNLILAGNSREFSSPVAATSGIPTTET